MDQPTATIIGATIAAIVAIGGWNVSHILGIRRENRTRRLEAILAHTQRQIEYRRALSNTLSTLHNN